MLNNETAILWDDALLTPHLETQVNKLGPRSKTNGLLHALTRQHSYDSLYQYLRFVVKAVCQVYGPNTVELVQQVERVNSMRLLPLNSVEEDIIEIYFQIGDSESVDLGDRAITVVPTDVGVKRAREDEGETAAEAVQPTQLDLAEEPAAKKPRTEDSEWIIQFEKLQAFHRSFGHLNVDAPLREWLDTQEQLNGKGELSVDRLEKLKEVGLVWAKTTTIDTAATATNNDESSATTTPAPEKADESAAWDAQYNQLSFFHQLQGHCNVPKHFPSDPTLPKWVKQQRQRYHEEQLTPHQVQKMEALHFVWGLGEDPVWDDFYAQLAAAQGAYNEENKMDDLGEWVSQQRLVKEHNQLSEQKVAKLESIGFEWIPADVLKKRKVARKSIGVALSLPTGTQLLEEKIKLQEDTVALQEGQVALLKEKLELCGQKVEWQKANRKLVQKLVQMKPDAAAVPKASAEEEAQAIQRLKERVAGQERTLEEQASKLKEQDEQIRKVLQQIEEKKEAIAARNAAEDMVTISI